MSSAGKSKSGSSCCTSKTKDKSSHSHQHQDQAKSTKKPGKYFKKKTFCLITGASKGLGRCLTIQLAEKFAPGSTIVVTARNKQALESLKSDIESKRPGIQVLATAVDLSKPDETEYASLLKKWIESGGGKEFQCAIVVHNAGALNDTSKSVLDSDSMSELRSYFDMNLLSAVSLNCCFVKALPNVPLKLIVNISSVNARMPAPSTALYSTAKAARHMYFKNLAVDEPKLRILSFEPGAMKTDLLTEAATKSHSDMMKQGAQAMLEGKTQVPVFSPDQSASNLIKVIEEDSWTNGDSVDSWGVA